MSNLHEENSYRSIIFEPLSRRTITMVDIFADKSNKQNNRTDAIIANRTFLRFGK